MADSMVERAAKAHYERLHYTAWENLTPSTRDGFIAAMRAAIEAMREPTVAMERCEPYESQFPPDTSESVKQSWRDEYGKIWRHMIDAALTKEEGNG